MIGQRLSLRDQRNLVEQKPGYPASQNNKPLPTSLSGMGDLEKIEGRDTRLRQQPAAPRGMFDAFVNTCQRWRLTQSEQLILLGYEGNDDLGMWLLSGHVPARTRDVKDRIGYVLEISLGLGTLFNDATPPELEWMTTRHPRLEESPLDHILKGRMVNLITVAHLVSIERNV